MFWQAISLMIIQRYSSRLDGRSKHEAINPGASQPVGRNKRSALRRTSARSRVTPTPSNPVKVPAPPCGLRIALASSRQKGGLGERSGDRAAQCATLIAPYGFRHGHRKPFWPYARVLKYRQRAVGDGSVADFVKTN